MTRTIELSGPPNLARLYAGAVATARGRSGKGGLPDLVVRRDGIRVDPDALADYDRVCGFTVGNTLPSTYLHNLAFPLQAALFADRAYPYPMLGSVHLENTLTQHRPVGLGEELAITVTARRARPHRRGVQVDVVSRAHSGDELVWEGLAVYLYRGQSIDEGAPPDSADPMAPGEVPEPPDGPGAIWRLPADLGRKFSRVSGDVNPIHLNPYTAKAMGFRRTIVHGMWSQGAMLAAIESRLTDSYLATMAFRRPVLIPGRTRFVAARGSADGDWDLALREGRNGKVLVSGTVRAG